MRSEKEIQSRAMRLLRSTGICKPPVDVFAVARSLGILVRLEKGDSELSGALYRLPSQTVIGVNKEHPPVRRRFTIAHEIGHFDLHEQSVFIDRSFPAADMGTETPLFRRDTVSSQAIDIKEIEANRFAAALLIPESFLLSDVETLQPPLSSKIVGILAKRYQVSSQAMTFRLLNLGVPIEQV
jgi:Zn-dependent peptidase ImmA (M78 family)